MNIKKEHLAEGLKELHPGNFDSIDDLLYGDIDLEVYHLEGLNLSRTIKGVTFNVLDLERIEEIANLGDKEHMEIYKKHGLFHDGGDDLDYGGSFVAILVDIIKWCLKNRAGKRMYLDESWI